MTDGAFLPNRFRPREDRRSNAKALTFPPLIRELREGKTLPCRSYKLFNDHVTELAMENIKYIPSTRRKQLRKHQESAQVFEIRKIIANTP